MVTVISDKVPFIYVSKYPHTTKADCILNKKALNFGTVGRKYITSQYIITRLITLQYRVNVYHLTLLVEKFSSYM